MNLILQTLLASLAAVTVENVIFTTAFGTSTLIELTRKKWNILSFGGFITAFAVLGSIISWLFEKVMLQNSIAQRFMPSAYILSIGIVYIFTLIAIWLISKKVFKKLKKYVHLSAFNCTVLSALFNNTITGAELPQRILYSAQIGIGFALATYIFSVNYNKLNSEDIPSAFSGFPIYLLYIGIVSMIVYAVGF